jgi:hypothetical protein
MVASKSWVRSSIVVQPAMIAHISTIPTTKYPVDLIFTLCMVRAARTMNPTV